MPIGIQRTFRITSNVVVTNSTTLVTVNLASAVAASETQHLRYWIPFSVGAAGGVRAQIVVPAGGSLFLATFRIQDTVTPAVIPALQTSSAAFTNALAVAGNHWLEIEATIINGTTAGNIDLRMAQNTANAASLTVLAGGWCHAVVS